MFLEVRELKEDEISVLPTIDEYPNKDIGLKTAYTRVGFKAESFYALFEKNNLEILGSLRIYRRPLIFGRKIPEGTALLYEEWVKPQRDLKGTNMETLVNEALMREYLKGTKKVLYVVEQHTQESTQIITKCGINALAGSYQDDPNNQTNAIFIYQKILGA